MKKQANQYDKIFKENIEAVIPSLMQNVLSINAVLVEDLPNDIQHTKERKPDVLKKVTDQEGSVFILHIEFQVANEAEMIYRMENIISCWLANSSYQFSNLSFSSETANLE